MHHSATGDVQLGPSSMIFEFRPPASIRGPACIGDPASIRGNTVIELAKTFGGWTACTQRIAQGKDFELIPTAKMETRHPIGGTFSREFSAFVIIAEL